MTSTTFELNQKARKINELSQKLNKAETSIRNSSNVVEAERKKTEKVEGKLKKKEEDLKTVEQQVSILREAQAMQDFLNFDDYKQRVNKAFGLGCETYRAEVKKESLLKQLKRYMG